MKPITDYFHRESKSEDAVNNLDDELAATMKTFNEDEPSSDLWVLYSSGDEIESNGNDNIVRKPRLLVKLPTPVSGLDTININKRKRDCPLKKKDFSCDEGMNDINKSQLSADSTEESCYMSPLRIDTSSETTPSSANRTKILNSPIKKSPRISRRSLFSNNRQRPIVKEDENGSQSGDDDNGKTGIDVGDPNFVEALETKDIFEDSSNDLKYVTEERLITASTGNNAILIDNKSCFEIMTDEEECSLMELRKSLLNKVKVKFEDCESEFVHRTPEKIVSAFNIIMSKSHKTTSKEERDDFPVRKKKRSSSESISEFLDDSLRNVKRRKTDIPKDGSGVNLNESQKSLYNYFLKTEISNKSKKSKKRIKKKKYFRDGTEILLVNPPPSEEQVAILHKMPETSKRSKRVLKRNSVEPQEKGICKEVEKLEKDAEDSSTRKSTASLNDFMEVQSEGDGSPIVAGERRTSQRLKVRKETKSITVSSEDKVSSKLPEKENALTQKSTKQIMVAKVVSGAHMKVAPNPSDAGVEGQSNSSREREEIVILTESAKKIIVKEAYVKLAPLFLAKEELRKKQVFLQSGTPEVLKRKLEQQRKIEAELKEKSEFPVVSHTLQYETGLFPWNLAQNPSFMSNLPTSEALPLTQEEVEMLTKTKKFHFGIISDVPTQLGNLLMSAKPPTFKEAELDIDFNFSSDKIDEYMPCFCSSDLPGDETAHEATAVDVEKFERVYAGIMRSILPPGVAFQMGVDLSSNLPVPSPDGFVCDHISVLPTNHTSVNLRKKMLLQLKQDYPGLPINRWFKIFYQKRKSYGGLYSYEKFDLEEESERAKKMQQGENIINLSGSDDELVGKSQRGSGIKNVGKKNSSSHVMLSSESWADMFAPKCYDDACILGKNLSSLNKLKSWLEKWKIRSSKLDKKTKTANGYSDEEDYSSGSEFYSSDDEENSRDSGKSESLPNVAIVIGECGSGKTSSVYAIAKDLGFKVLEINASSKRSGKHILDAVKEATRSHQVNNNSPLHSFFNDSKGGSAKKSKKLQPKTQENSSGISVILVEDVDVVFDTKDDGFITALTSLTTSSKRPFILEVHTSEPLKMGTNNSILLQEILVKSCPHLNNLLNKQSKSPLLLPFQLSQKNTNAEALLRIVCLSEGVWVSKQWCECIFRDSFGDFRQAVQQAHFWAGSVARANVLHEGKGRYSEEIMQDMRAYSKFDTCQNNKIVANPCGCKRTNNCSFPYSWMYKDYVKHIWLNLDEIVKKEKIVGKDEPNFDDPNRTPSSQVKLNVTNNCIPLLKCRLHEMIVSPLEVETNIRNGNISLSESDLNPENLSNNYKLILSCPAKISGVERKVRSKRIGHSARRRLLYSNVEQEEQQNDANIKKLKTDHMNVETKSSPQCQANMKCFSEALELLCTSDVLLNKQRNVNGSGLGKDMVFQMGTLPNIIDLSMQVTTSERSIEMKAKLHKSTCTASQSQMILPLLPTNWVLGHKMLAHDVIPHIRETCRIQKQLIEMGRGRTRQSGRHPTLRRFGPSLREALCGTFLENISPNVSKEDCPQESSEMQSD